MEVDIERQISSENDAEISYEDSEESVSDHVTKTAADHMTEANIEHVTEKVVKTKDRSTDLCQVAKERSPLYLGYTDYSQLSHSFEHPETEIGEILNQSNTEQNASSSAQFWVSMETTSESSKTKIERRPQLSRQLRVSDRHSGHDVWTSAALKKTGHRYSYGDVTAKQEVKSSRLTHRASWAGSETKVCARVRSFSVM